MTASHLRRNALLAALCALTAAPVFAQQDSAQHHLTQGIHLASQKHYKAAQLEFEKADALHPEDFAIQFNLGQVELALGDNARAELTLTQALKLQPNSVDTLLLLAQADANQSRGLDALDLLVRARTLAPSNPDILYHMARISMSQGYYADAVPLLQQAQKLAPARTDIQIALGESDYNAEKTDAAIAVFQTLTPAAHSALTFSYLGLAHIRLGRFAEAKENFHQCLRLEPHDNFCLFQLGRIAHLQGDSIAAESVFRRVLQADPHYPAALLELATLRMEQKRFAEAIDLLHRYTLANQDATGYYKLAMTEKALHQSDAAQHDLAEFQRLSRDATPTTHPYDHLLDYLDDRSKLSTGAREQQDLNSLLQQAQLHPDQPELLYSLTEAYLKTGNLAEARKTVAQLDTQHPDDARTLTGLGVLLAQYSLYDDAIAQFQAALTAQPDSDDALFDLANAEFRKGSFAEALSTAQRIFSPPQHEEAYLSLLADIDAHLGNTTQAESLYRSALERNPDNDQDYLSLALLQMREGSLSDAEQTLTRGRQRIPASGKVLWGQGLLAVLNGDTATASSDLERAVELLPEWPGSYATLGFFYYQTGQIDKAREVLDRFKNSGTRGGLDIARIEQTLAQAQPSSTTTSLEPAQRMQIFQLALYLVDKTL
ncbi:MAG: tetratricopeptide repeat protein [Acidobacteriaceae bacterium]